MILIAMITILIRVRNLRMTSLPKLSGLLVIVLALTGCGGQAGNDQEGLSVVATTSVWGNVVEEIVGGDAAVDILIPAGADAHDYQATPQQVASLQAADLVVANGLGLEEGLEDILDSAVADGAALLELAPALDALPFADHGEEPDEEGDDQSGDDPHVWFDPTRVATAAHLIAARLTEIDDSVDWSTRAKKYSGRLLDADEEIVRILGEVPEENRKLVTNHDAFGYFADRYGFEVIAVVIPGGSTLSEPSSAEMAALIEEIEHEGVHAIFAETSQPTRLAETVAAEAGDDVAVVELYTESLGEPGSGADTLIGMLLTDARLIADALSE